MPSVGWTRAPYQDLTYTKKFGFLAFSKFEIEKIVFKAGDGPELIITDWGYNDETEVWEYCFTLDPSLFPDGLTNLHAVVHPYNGAPRHEILPVNFNAGGTLPTLERWVSVNGNDNNSGTQSNPFRTVAKAAMDIQNIQGNANGGIIYLGAGDHDIEGGI